MIDTPIAGLVNLALRDPTLGDLARRAAANPPELALVGPAGARPFVASALAQDGLLLVVTATGREADDLTAELERRGRRRRCAVPVLGDPAARAAVTRRRHRRRPAHSAATARAARRRPAGPAVAGGGHDGALAAAADGVGPGPHRAGHVDGRRPRSPSRTSSPGSSNWPTPASTWSASAASSQCAAASSTSSRRPPNTPFASSSGATRSARCGCSRSPTSGRFRN